MTNLPDYDPAWYSENHDLFADQDSMMRQAEMVPLHVLQRMREYARRPGEAQNTMLPEHYDSLKRHIAEHGITSPIWIDYHPEKGVAHLSEGNHRLAIAEDLGMTHLPAVAFCSRRTGRGSVLPVTYTGEMTWDGAHPQYMKPSDFPEMESTGKPPPGFRTAAYQDFFVVPQRGPGPVVAQPGKSGPPPMREFPGEDQNRYDWTQTHYPFDYPTNEPILHPDHLDEDLQPRHWKDNFVGPDPRTRWTNPMDALRDHAAHLAAQHGIGYRVHSEWNDTRGPSDEADSRSNEIHVRPVTNRMRYLVALHEMGHCVGGTKDMPGYGPMTYNRETGFDEPSRHPLEYNLEYAPTGYSFDYDMGQWRANEPTDSWQDQFGTNWRHPSEWRPIKPSESMAPEDPSDPDSEYESTAPFTPEENKLETEARAWDWAIQHSAVKVTPQLLRQMYRYLTSYADPREIAYYSPTFKRLWNEGEHPESGEGWHEPYDPADALFRQKALGLQSHYIPYVPSKATVSDSKALAARLRVTPPPSSRKAAEGDTGADMSGAMVALMLKPEQAKKLYVPGGEPEDNMHITLVYFSDKAKDRKDWDDLDDVLENVAREFAKLDGKVGGTGTFAPKDKSDPTPYFATPDLPGLNELQARVQEAVEQAGFPVSRDHSFNPHITLKYMDDPDYHEEVEVPSPLSFDDLTLMVGGARTDFELQGELVKTSDWHEDDHPRSPVSGKFTVKEDIHEVKVYDKKTGKEMYTAKRCDKCGVIYGERPGKTVTSCPTCGEHPKRHHGGTLHQLRPQSRVLVALDQAAVADALGWQFWKENAKQHKMYRWTGPGKEGQVISHVVTGYGDHGNAERDALKIRKNMKACMNGTCDHIATPNTAPLYDTPQVKAPVFHANQEVTYGGNSWWVMQVDGGMALIYDATGQEDIVPVQDLRAAASQDRIDRNKRFVDDLANRWEEQHNTRDPDFVFVFFGGKLKVEAWEPNLRVRNMADALVKEHGFLGLGDYEEFGNDTTEKWVTGEVWRTEAGNLKVEITQLADPDIIEAARLAVDDYFGKAEDEPDYTRFLHPTWTEAS